MNRTIYIAAALAGILLISNASPSHAATSECSSENKSISILRNVQSGHKAGPAIEVSASGALQVRLSSASQTPVDLESLRVKYKIFDITKRVIDHVGGIRSSMSVSADLLPVGRHGITISVRDEAGNATRVKLTLMVRASAGSSCTA